MLTGEIEGSLLVRCDGLKKDIDILAHEFYKGCDSVWWKIYEHI